MRGKEICEEPLDPHVVANSELQRLCQDQCKGPQKKLGKLALAAQTGTSPAWHTRSSHEAEATKSVHAVMGVKILRINQDIVEIEQDMLVENIPKDVVHKLLKNGGSIQRQNGKTRFWQSQELKVIFHLSPLIQINLHAAQQTNLVY